MRELKRVENPGVDIRAAAQQEEYVMGAEVESAGNKHEEVEINPTEEVKEKRKTSVEAKKKATTSAKGVGANTKSAPRPEQKKLADKVGEAKRPSVKMRPVKTPAPDLATKTTATKSKPALKKAMSVTTPKAKPEVGRTKSLGPKEKKVAPPTAPKPAKLSEEVEPSDMLAETEIVGDQKPAGVSVGAPKPGGGASSGAKPAPGKPGAAGGAGRANIPPATREKKGPGGSVGPKKEVPEKKEPGGKKRPAAEKAKEAAAPRSKGSGGRAAGSPAEVKPAVGKGKKAGGIQGPGVGVGGAAPGDSDVPGEPPLTGRTPPAVPPKPSSPNKRHVSPSQGSQSNRSIAANPGHKNSLAERARLVGALEVGPRTGVCISCY